MNYHSAIIVCIFAFIFYLTYKFLINIYVPPVSRDRYEYYAGTTMEMAAGMLFLSIWLGCIFDAKPLKIVRGMTALILMGSSMGFAIWARKSNPYFIPVLAPPHKIITAGPYEYLKHPGYLAYMGMALSIPFLFWSLVGLIIALMYCAFIFARLLEEDEFLTQCEIKSASSSSQH